MENNNEYLEMEAKIRHLEIIQSIIVRLAGNSFQLKGWTITLTGAIIALLTFKADVPFLLSLAAIFPIFSFAFLDCYYLSQERIYKKMYDAVRSKEYIDFNLNTLDEYKDRTTTISNCFFYSRSISWFYLPILATVILLTIHVYIYS